MVLAHNSWSVFLCLFISLNLDSLSLIFKPNQLLNSISLGAVWERASVCLVSDRAGWKWRRVQSCVCELQIKALLELVLMNRWHQHTHTYTPTMAHKNTDTQKAWGFYTLWTWGTPRNRPVLLHLQRNQYIPSLYLLYRFIRPSSLLFGGLGALYQQCVLNTRVDLAVSRWQQSGFVFFSVCELSRVCCGGLCVQ